MMHELIPVLWFLPETSVLRAQFTAKCINFIIILLFDRNIDTLPMIQQQQNIFKFECDENSTCMKYIDFYTTNATQNKVKKKLSILDSRRCFECKNKEEIR